MYICKDMLEDFRLKVFLTVASTGSFTRAATLLGITQPAVSQNITTLENQTGTRLLVRAKGECSLTAEGLAFKEYAEKILYWYSAADSLFGSGGRLTFNRPVRIAADPVVSAYMLPRAISSIMASNAEAGFEIERFTPGESIPESVFEPEIETSEEIPGTHFGTPEDADVEITVSPSPETMDFEGESRLVGVMDASVVASPSNKSVAYAASSESKPFSTLAGVHVSNRFAVWAPYVPLLAPDIRARVAITSSSIEAVKTLTANSGRIVGVVPSCSVRDEIAAGSLLPMPVQLPDLAFDIHFNALPEFAGKTICRLLFDTLKNTL